MKEINKNGNVKNKDLCPSLPLYCRGIICRNVINILIILLIISITILVLIGCGSYRCTTQAHELMDAVDTILISEKLCKDANDCRTKNYVLCRSSKGACISVYGVRNVNIIKRIVNLCIEKRTSNRNMKYELYIHPKMKMEDYNQKPTVKLILQEE